MTLNKCMVLVNGFVLAANICISNVTGVVISGCFLTMAIVLSLFEERR